MTKFAIHPFARSLSVFLLIPILGIQPSLFAQDHVVSSADLQKEIAAATGARQHNVAAITGFLSSPQAEKLLKYTGIDPARVKTAVSALTDQELAQLAARSAKAQADLAAGRITDRDLLIILLGIVALILIIVAVR